MPSKKTIYIIIAVLIFLIALGYFYYRKGKNTVTLQALPGELPGTSSSGNITGASNDEIKGIANGLHEEMDGLNLFGHDMDIYNRALLLNDADIVKVYNTFNTLYQQKSGGDTLTAWLESELFSSTFESAAINLIGRLKKLNCL